jgi:hypothetical protein
MEKKFLEIKDVFNPEEVIPKEIIRDTFVTGMAQFWEHAKIAFRYKLKDELREAKNNYFKSLEGILSRKFEESNSLTRKTLEQFEQYRDRDWMNEEFMNEMSDVMGKLIEEVRAAQR